MADMTYHYDGAGSYLAGSYAFANNEVDETLKVLDVPMSTLDQRAKSHRAFIYNPGAVDITVRFYTGELIGGVVRYAEIGTAITATAVADFNYGIVEGLLSGSYARVGVENDTVVGGAGAFTAEVIVRSIYD